MTTTEVQRIDIAKVLQDQGPNLPAETVAALQEALACGWTFAHVVDELCEDGYELRVVQLESDDPGAVISRLIGTQAPDSGDAEGPPCMVALYPDEVGAAQICMEDGLPADDLHVTLAYLGKRQMTPDRLGAVMQAVEDTFRECHSMTGRVGGGFGVFHNADGHALWASVEVPGLRDLRECLVRNLAAVGVPQQSEHDFTPHMTLKYLQPDEEFTTPDVANNPLLFGFSKVYVKVGDQKFAYPLLPPTMDNQQDRAGYVPGQMGVQDSVEYPDVQDLGVDNTGATSSAVASGEKWDATQIAIEPPIQLEGDLHGGTIAKDDPGVGAVHVDVPLGSKKPKVAKAAVSQKPWGQFQASDYTEEQWARACLVDKGPDINGKQRYSLPVREPDGTLNRNGCAAAAARINQVDVPPGKRKVAARRLASIYRNELGIDPPENLVEIAKAIELFRKDDARRFTLAPWYVPDSEDAHGDWTDTDELQNALWQYVDSGDREIRLQHNIEVSAGRWVEAVCWPFPVTVPMIQPYGSTEDVEFPAGTCFLGVIWEPWSWQMVLDGRITGLSMAGSAIRVEMPVAEDVAKAMGTMATIPAVQIALAQTFAFYLAAHSAHWNVTGPDFAEYHRLYGEIYEDVYGAVDPLAEILRQLGVKTPTQGMVSFAAARMGMPMGEPDAVSPDLSVRNQDVIRCLDTAFQAATSDNQQGVANYLAERIAAHQKWAWQLEAM